jgi:hypothetical protein
MKQLNDAAILNDSTKQFSIFGVVLFLLNFGSMLYGINGKESKVDSIFTKKITHMQTFQQTCVRI